MIQSTTRNTLKRPHGAVVRVRLAQQEQAGQGYYSFSEIKFHTFTSINREKTIG
jgi:hypothetical protein